MASLCYWITFNCLQYYHITMHMLIAVEDQGSIMLHIVCMHSADTGSMSWIADKEARAHVYGWQL